MTQCLLIVHYVLAQATLLTVSLISPWAKDREASTSVLVQDADLLKLGFLRTSTRNCYILLYLQLAKSNRLVRNGPAECAACTM
ncbi:hypothetical protein GDO78_006528 [Eleutherodactylus coqui]|uniref:Uncharacterized protein n=1 Tax=Eleutherodactylus coqui TaxID=57060 RepID=A0A8J6FR35_ELECQ|nr:hypothetical protein GDO78_006528 [Eleutherodactylus coqui]